MIARIRAPDFITCKFSLEEFGKIWVKTKILKLKKIKN